MDQTSYIAAKRARARRIILQKQKHSKRLKTASQLPNPMSINIET